MLNQIIITSIINVSHNYFFILFLFAESMHKQSVGLLTQAVYVTYKALKNSIM